MKACWTAACLLAALWISGAGGAVGDNPKKFNFDAFFKRLDTNMDGRLSKDEFLKMADRAKEKEQARAKLSQAYDMLDPEMKGITKDIFRRFLENGKSADATPKGAK
jgi:Ca2+-binding EF-hand superfamily protein